MNRMLVAIVAWTVLALTAAAPPAAALSRDRWTNAQPYGLFFNDYGPNFYAGFAPREQNRDRIAIHVARGNQLRLRIVLSDEAIDNYVLDQAARHALYKELMHVPLLVYIPENDPAEVPGPVSNIDILPTVHVWHLGLYRDVLRVHVRPRWNSPRGMR